MPQTLLPEIDLDFLPDVKEDLTSILEELYEIRHDLHRFPEPSMREEKTADRIREELDCIDLPWQAVGGTGTLAKLEGAYPGPTILLRADIDALPLKERSNYPYPSVNEGFMHACGHDVHTTALLGAAKLLTSYKEYLHGSVHFIFQQAEELGHGSQYFLTAGTTDGAEAIYGFHVTPEVPLGSAVLTDGTDAASCDYMLIRLHGKKAHIVKPNLGVDAAYAASDLVLKLRGLRSSFDPIEQIFIGIGKVSAGNTWNIVADYAEIEGTVRTLSKDAHDIAIAETKKLIEGVAAFHGVDADIIFENNTTCLINDKEAYKVMKEVATTVLGGKEKILKRPYPLGYGGDDFAQFSDRIPGCFIHLGTAIEGNPDSMVPLHSENIYISDDVIPIGTELLTRCALSHLL